MTNNELELVLDLHKKWLNGDPDGARADLRGDDLRGANLYGANLTGADLRGADLYGAKSIPFIPMTCPSTGSFIGWKKCLNDLIVKLYIYSDSKRSSGTGRKCRCDKAKVLSIENIDGTKADVDYAVSMYDSSFIYAVGSVVKVDNFDEDRFNECSFGIHFFIDRQEAVEYIF